jgi:murein DD-endopeptidase MepM/ murein hydrolase activator NlpD/cell division septum initiation protein DivIVA
VATFNAGSIEATLDVDRSPFTRGLEEARAQGRRFAAERWQARLDVDTGRVTAQLAALEAQLAAVDGRHVQPRIDVDVARQLAELEALRAELDRIDGRRVSPDMSGGTSEMTAFASASASAGSGLSSLIGIGVALGPALIPGIAGATAAVGGLVAMLGAAGGGAGVFGAGLIGNITRVVGAQKDLETASTQAAAAAKTQEAAQERLRSALEGVATASRAAADARRNAARAEQQAEESLADTRRNAARSEQQAEEGLASARRNAAYSTQQAEQSLASAQDGVRRAQQDLNQARADATQRLQEMRDQLAGAELNEEGSELAVRAARQRLQEVMRDPQATKLQQDEAELAYRRALLQMKDARKANDDLQASVKKAQREGVNGDTAVKAAKDRLTQSRQAEATAEANVSRTRQQGAQQVTDAERTLARAQSDGARAIADAEQNLAQTRADNARAIEDADRRVTDAQRQVGQAQKAAAEASDALAAANRAQGAAMADLSGPAAVFVQALTQAKNAWNAFLDATESDTLGVATQALGMFVRYLPMLVPVVHAVTPAITGLLDELDRWASGGGMDAIVGFLTTYGPPAITAFGHLVGNLAVLVGNLMVAFAPLGQAMLDWLVAVTAGWAEWSRTLDTDQGFQGFLRYVTETGPLFVGFLDAAWDALINIGRALAPAAVPILTALTWGLRQIADMDPKALGLVAAGIELVVGAILLATSGGANPLGWLMVLSGTTVGLSNLADQSDETKGRLDKLGGTVKDVVGWLGDRWDLMWTRTLRPDLRQIRDVIENEFLPAWDDFWPVIRPIFKALGVTLAFQAEVGMNATLKIIRDVLRLMAGAMEFWTGVMTGDWGKMHRGLRTQSAGSLGLLKTAWSRGMFGIVGVVGSAVLAISRKWGGIRAIFAAPVNWIIRNVLNRLINGVNAIANRLGRSDILRPFASINLPGGNDRGAPGGTSAQNNNEGRLGPIRAAAGTVLPGFTPGVDTLHYKTPNGPDLHLGGGEAVMVPEFTAMHGGPQGIAELNKQARAAAKYGAKASMSFAAGGVVWPTVGRRVSTYGGHDGVDINQPPGPNYGAPIYAYRTGRVTYTGWGRGYGDAVFEKGDVGPEVVYGHMSRVVAHTGQRVRAGQTIGYVGATGHAFGPHLHFGVPGGTYAGAMALLRGATHVAGGGGGGGIPAAIDPVGMLGSLLGRVRNTVTGDVPGGRFGRTIAGGVLDTVGAAARGWAGRQAQNLLALTPAGLAVTLGRRALAALSGKSPKGIARDLLDNYGWSAAQFGPLEKLWTRESNWNVHALNRSSGAYGIPQSLPASKMAAAGADWHDNPATQIRWGLDYIKDRYGSPAAAWAHSERRGWYDNGGIVPPGVTTVLNASDTPEALLNDDQWRLARRAMGVDRPHGSADGWSRADIERLIEAVAAADPVVVPQSDNTKELIDLLGFELRVQGRGPR